MRHPSIRLLPDVFYALLPELDAIDWPEEERASCISCPMVATEASSGEDWRRFRADVRCCTFHPNLPNFLVGRILRREDIGSERMRARMTEGHLLLQGVPSARAWSEYRASASRLQFGQDVHLRCPYFVEGELSCSVWADRGAACRTWFCRTVEGKFGDHLWVALLKLLRHIEMTIADWCVSQGTPDPEPTTTDEWASWYRTCADRVDALQPAQLQQSDKLRDLRDILHQADVGRTAPLPDVLVRTGKQLRWRGEDLLVTGYSEFDPLVLPGVAFDLLALIDGKRTWQEALSLVELEEGEELTEHHIRQLVQWGVVEAAATGPVPR